LNPSEMNSVQILIGKLKDDNPDDKITTIRLLGEKKSIEVVNCLLIALKEDEDWKIKQEVAKSLVKIGELAIESLLLALETSNKCDEAWILKALNDLGYCREKFPDIDAKKKVEIINFNPERNPDEIVSLANNNIKTTIQPCEDSEPITIMFLRQLAAGGRYSYDDYCDGDNRRVYKIEIERLYKEYLHKENLDTVDAKFLALFLIMNEQYLNTKDSLWPTVKMAFDILEHYNETSILIYLLDSINPLLRFKAVYSLGFCCCETRYVENEIIKKIIDKLDDDALIQWFIGGEQVDVRFNAYLAIKTIIQCGNDDTKYKMFLHYNQIKNCYEKIKNCKKIEKIKGNIYLNQVQQTIWELEKYSENKKFKQTNLSTD